MLTERRDPVRSASSTTPVASSGSSGRPSARANTLVEPAGHDAERGNAVVHAVGQQPVDDLVDRAVAAEGDDDVGAVAHRPAGQGGGVPAVGGLGDLELGVAAQGVGEDVALASGGGGRARVGHDEDPHGARYPALEPGRSSRTAR